jgi:SAM-dependent methyltransferase
MRIIPCLPFRGGDDAPITGRDHLARRGVLGCNAGRCHPRNKELQMSENSETQYEKNQRFNALVSWLHTRRYRTILALLEKISREKGGAPIRVVDIGCAHAKLFSVLNERLPIVYTGIEVNARFVEAARARYGSHPNFSIIHDSAVRALPAQGHADVIVALETLEHIPEHDVVRIVEAVAAARPGCFVASVPVEIGPAIWLKNVGSLLTGYMRHRDYRWRETFWAGLYQLDRLPPHGTDHIGFDWRWLAQTIRHNMKIVELRKLPFRWLPAALAFSVYFVAEPRPA